MSVIVMECMVLFYKKDEESSPFEHLAGLVCCFCLILSWWTTATAFICLLHEDQFYLFSLLFFWLISLFSSLSLSILFAFWDPFGATFATNKSAISCTYQKKKKKNQPALVPRLITMRLIKIVETHILCNWVYFDVSIHIVHAYIYSSS